MRYLHTMIRIRNVEESLDFWCNKMGLKETRRVDNEQGRFTLIFLAGGKDESRAKQDNSPELELTYNWEPEDDLGNSRNFGHLAYKVDDIYATCQQLMDAGVTINRPHLNRAFTGRRRTSPCRTLVVYGKHRQLVATNNNSTLR